MSEHPYIADDLQPLAVDVEDLALDPSNARIHSDRNLQTIADSLNRFGQRTPLVVQRTDGDQRDIIRKGNGTYEAATQILDWTHLACVFVEESDTTSTAYAIADNRTGELSAWADETLERLIESLPDDLRADTGFTDDEIAALNPNWDLDDDDPGAFSDDDFPDLEFTEDDTLEAKITVVCDPADKVEIEGQIADLLTVYPDAKVK